MNFRTTLALALTLTAFPAVAQTAAEQLQRGIFAQESQGNLDSAITIYRQLANSTLTPREIAAQAQARLVQALLRKGDISTATREMERLERDFSEYSKLIGNLSGHGPQPANEMADKLKQELLALMPLLQTANFEGGRTGSISGKVEMLFWTNPASFMVVESAGRKFVVKLAAPSAMLNSGGITRTTFKAGDTVLIQAQYPSPAVEKNGVEGVQALKLSTMPDQKAVFDRSLIP